MNIQINQGSKFGTWIVSYWQKGYNTITFKSFNDAIKHILGVMKENGIK